MAVDRADGPRSRFPGSVGRHLGPVLSLGLFVGLWYGAVEVTGVSPLLLPPPAAVARTLAENVHSMSPHVAYTGGEILLGWVTGVAVGAALAMVMAASRSVRLVVYPLLVTVRVVPLVVFAPLIIMAFGPTLATRILIAVVLTFFPVAIAVLDGLVATPPKQLALLRSVGAPRWRRVVHVRLPNALPTAFAGLKVSTPIAVQGVVLAEFLASSRGIGHQLLATAAQFETELLFAYIAALVVFGVGLFGAVSALERAVGWEEGSGVSFAGGLTSSSSVDREQSVVEGVTVASSLAVVVVVVWQVGASTVPHASLFLPRPENVFATLLGSVSLFASAGLRTLHKFAVGWTVGAAIGLLVGTVSALAPRVRPVVNGYLVGFRAVPDLAVVPLLLVWLRVSFESAVVLVAMSTFFPVAVGTAAGLARLPRAQRELLASVSTSRLRVLLVRFRYAVPSLFAGVKLSVVTGFTGAIIAEWFVAQRGLGVIVLQGMNNTQPELTYAASLAVFVLAFGLFGLSVAAQRRASW